MHAVGDCQQELGRVEEIEASSPALQRAASHQITTPESRFFSSDGDETPAARLSDQLGELTRSISSVMESAKSGQAVDARGQRTVSPVVAAQATLRRMQESAPPASPATAITASVGGGANGTSSASTSAPLIRHESGRSARRGSPGRTPVKQPTTATSQPQSMRLVPMTTSSSNSTRARDTKSPVANLALDIPAGDGSAGAVGHTPVGHTPLDVSFGSTPRARSPVYRPRAGRPASASSRSPGATFRSTSSRPSPTVAASAGQSSFRATPTRSRYTTRPFRHDSELTFGTSCVHSS